ncbi:MAG: hypothetical protein L6300_16305 [Syntrophaceae bacterium]|nr:hypothetical protein [Syntrophaceae bacterium]
MSDWESTLPHSWLLFGLPEQPETNHQVYTFNITRLDYFVGEDRQAIYLHIPEIGCRDAEGLPRYPEQEAWVKTVLAERQIRAKYVSLSTWQFDTQDDAIAFEKLLWEFGAMRLWTLTRRSKEPGVLLVHFIFKIIPSKTGTLRLFIETEPKGLTFRNKQVAFVRRILSKHKIKAHKRRNQDFWEFETFDDAQRFEEAIRRKRGPRAQYAGLL